MIEAVQGSAGPTSLNFGELDRRGSAVWSAAHASRLPEQELMGRGKMDIADLITPRSLSPNCAQRIKSMRFKSLPSEQRQ